MSEQPAQAINKEVKKAAYNYLARREHSLQELRQKLTLKEYSGDDIELVLEKLVEQDIQSDLRYAQSVIRQRIAKGYGRSYINNELKHKGLASGTIHEALISEPTDWFELAKGVYQKRYGDTAITDQKDKAKRVRFLQSRGFDFEQISAAMTIDEVGQ
ncbi:regulatory protein RecX [Thalassotalea mangrovi]|uniref:Regulatory protein RecX n=1 Tax=Thalassotalea mangrovi TaxID=2572245 RepID=A0A4U1B3W4_9GAMM|nr:regulatory protein RecX [Thalassotalea mangrovi]TKB44645.1 regulatory protein RecX [Thalassotalea mangrovi]